MEKEKIPDYGSAAGTPIFKRLCFTVKDDHLETGTGPERREIYFMRLQPRNMDILSVEESQNEHRCLQAILDKDGTAPSFFSLDKTEGDEQLRRYYEKLVATHPDHEYINGAILQYLSDLENEENSIVERAHYMILRCRNNSEFKQFDAVARSYMKYYLADWAELVLVLKNFFLRDYTPVRPALWNEDIRLKYTSFYDAAKPRQRRRPDFPDEQAYGEKETLRLLLPARLRFDTRYVEQGDLYRQTMRVRGWPAELAHPSALQEIGAMAGVTLRIYLEPISMQETTRMLTQQINHRTSDMYGARRASERVRGGVEKDRIEDAYKGQLQRQSKMYYVTVLAEVYGRTKDELRTRMENLRTAFSAQGMVADTMFYEQREGFCSMLPYGVNLVDLFKRNMPTGTISALYPFSSSRKVDPEGLVLGKTSTGSPFFWDPFLRTGDVTNGVVLIAGTSGQGKSYLQKKILSQLIARDYAVYSLDAENEYIDMTQRSGGTNQDCGGGSVRINPLEVRRLADHRIEEREFRREEIANDPEAFSGSSALLQHLNWLSAFHRLLLPGLNEMQHASLQILLLQHYAAMGIDKDFDPHGKPATIYPTYTTLYTYVEKLFDHFDEMGDEVKLFVKDDLRQILLALAVLKDGAQSAIFNGHTNVQNARVINFIVSGLLSGDEQTRDAGLFNVLSWIWNRVVTYRERLAFAVDELYLYLNPVVVEYLRNFAKRARKYEALMIMTTQNLSDFSDPAIMHLCQPLFELAIHKFLFYPGDVNRDAMKKLLQLSDSELDIISFSRQRHCLVKCGTEKYHLKVGTLPYERSLFGTAGGR